MTGESTPTPQRPRATATGTVVTIVLSVVLLGFGTVMAFFSFFLAFVSDACGTGTISCNEAGIGAGILVAFIGSIAAALLGAVFGAVWAAKRRRFAWIFTIIGGVLVVLMYAIGAAITFASSGGWLS